MGHQRWSGCAPTWSAGWRRGPASPIDRPYRAGPPERALPGGWQRFRWIVTDPATWRDLAWLLPGALVGFVLGLLAVVIPLYGLEGITLLPLWL